MKKTVKTKQKSLMVVKPESSLYKTDIYAWFNQQLDLLKHHDLEHLDLPNLIEEMESFVAQERKGVKSQLVRLLQHLLKSNYPTQKTTKSWQRSIVNSEVEIIMALQDSPSLINELNQLMLDAYALAKRKAAIETGDLIKAYPKECPWNIQELLSGIDFRKNKYKKGT